MKTCVQCAAVFEVTDQDRKFYKKMQMPEPTLCPDCRMQRRLAWRNERNLYKRKCDLTGKQIISAYSPRKPFIVYDYKIWLGDEWDPMDYGKDFQFPRSFFEQFAELQLAIPKKNLFIEEGMENSDYCNYGHSAKNCYLTAGPYQSENCLYSWSPAVCTYDLDGYANLFSHYCYECISVENCNEVLYAEYCKNCNASAFLLDCISCEHCLGCVNLRHQKYCFLNNSLSSKEYFQKISDVFYSCSSLLQFQKTYQDFILQHPRKTARNLKAENCTGDLIRNCKNCQYCFDILDMQNSKYTILGGLQSYDIYDSFFIGEGAVESYECIGAIGCNSVAFQIYIRGNQNCFYCVSCNNCSHCFGCEGLRHKKYCILNRQYSQSEYEKLLPKIIEHMRKIGEWGEFFPIELSPFAYNESVAFEYFPLTKDEVLSRGWKWKKEEEGDFSDVVEKISAKDIPDTLADVSDDILKATIACEESGRPFRIVKPELDFYRKMNIPLPRLHPDIRYKKRLQRKNPYRLWRRSCQKCGTEIQTTYAPDRPEIVYCEQCYLSAVS